MTAEISADLLARAEAAYYAAFDRADSTADGVRAVVALVLAETQPEPTRWQWGVRRDGQRSIQIREEQLARSRFRTAKLVGRELLRRPLVQGPWELVEYRKAGE